VDPEREPLLSTRHRGDSTSEDEQLKPGTYCLMTWLFPLTVRFSGP
jgi:hypothetical protein